MKLYHLSKRNLDGKILKPRIPKNRLTNLGFEDSEIKRVCFSSSITGAISAISGSSDIGGALFVHEIEIERECIIKPSKAQVPDSEITKEKWVIKEITLHCTGIVLLKSLKDTINVSARKQYKKNISPSFTKFPIYVFNWKWLKKYTEKDREDGLIIKDIKKLDEDCLMYYGSLEKTFEIINKTLKLCEERNKRSELQDIFI